MFKTARVATPCFCVGDSKVPGSADISGGLSLACEPLVSSLWPSPAGYGLLNRGILLSQRKGVGCPQPAPQ